MQPLTYEIKSKAQKDQSSSVPQTYKYIKSWNSPKSKLKKNIEKIDEELLFIKEKIKTVENSPMHSLAKFSLQFLSKHQPQRTDENQELHFCSLLKEINEKESIIENMLSDMKLIEEKMNSLHYENMELNGQLQLEVNMRMAMEQEIGHLRDRLNCLNDLEYENERLKEDNMKLLKIIEESEMEKRYLHKDSAYSPKKEVSSTYDGYTYNHFYDESNIRSIQTYSQPNLEDGSPFYYIESQDSNLNPKEGICNVKRQCMSKINENSLKERRVNSYYYGYQSKDEREVCPYHERKCRSVEYPVNRKLEKPNHHIEEDNSKQPASKQALNPKDNNNQLGQQQFRPINQATSYFSIDNTAALKDQKTRRRNQKGMELMKESHSLIESNSKDLVPHQLETNLETLSSEQVNKLSPIGNNKVMSFHEKVNQLTESLNQSNADLRNKQKEFKVIEEENELLKKRLLEKKPKEALYEITESQLSLIQEENIQLSFHPSALFFSKPIRSEVNSIKRELKKGKLFSRIKINRDTSINTSSIHVKADLSDNLLLKPYDNKRLLCFSIKNQGFSLIEFIDYSDYYSSFTKDNTYLNHDNGMYIITGENNDSLYSYIYSNNSLNKLASLANNHSHSGLILYTKTASKEKCLVSLSGWHNKKVEEYSTKRNEWTSLSEMPIERGESAYLVLSNATLFAFFGYNCPQRKYLNTIDYCSINSAKDIENFKWKSLQYSYQKEPFSLYIKSHSLVTVSPQQVVILGGFDGKENQPIEYFIDVSFDEESNVRVSKVNRKLFNIDKNHLYNFTCTFSPLLNLNETQYQVGFDEEERAHVINASKMTHDIFYLD